LNAEGIYFEFKEKLKKAIVPVIREKFPAAPIDIGESREKNDFYTQLYAFLIEEVCHR